MSDVKVYHYTPEPDPLCRVSACPNCTHDIRCHGDGGCIFVLEYTGEPADYKPGSGGYQVWPLRTCGCAVARGTLSAWALMESLK
jgi:hypothetical protein